MKSVVIADFGAYTVEMPLDNSYKIRERDRKNRMKKEDREATTSAYFAGFIAIAFYALLFCLWLLGV